MANTAFTQRVFSSTRVTQTPADAATINITIGAGVNTFIKWTATQNTTINISSGTPTDGDEVTISITNDATLARIITLGTLLNTVGTIVGVVSKKSTIKLVADNGVFYEIARSVGI